MTPAIAEFMARSALLEGRVVHERPVWNSLASSDAIRHYCYGTSDGNPLWLDPGYGRDSCHGRTLAPPGFICSVLYPFLHGAPVEVPLLSLIGSISVEWHAHVYEGDSLSAEARQGAVSASYDRAGRAIAIVPAETLYRNQQGAVVATANGTMVRIEPRGEDRFLARSPSGYSPGERHAMDRALRRERRSGDLSPSRGASMVGTSLPVMMRGPLSIGDLICWQAGIGPSYRAGSLGYFDALQSPHTSVFNPVTGWPLKYSQQHEDFMMAAQRGMPAPFDNSLMRFAWIIPMLTDWMGDGGFLRRLTIETGLPLIYGDTTWYRAVIWGETLEPGKGLRQLDLRITGVNQLGQTTTTGSAVVELPLQNKRAGARPAGTKSASPAEAPPAVFRRIAEQAASRPDATAILCDGHRVSFAGLLSTSGAMAHAMRSIVAKAPPSLVGLVFDRSPDAIAAALAVMQSDAAFLFIDPGEPDLRIQELLRTARPDVLLADRRNADRLRRNLGGSGAHVVIWDGMGASPTANPAPAELQSIEGMACDETRRLAYVMTTSGSSGRPKCVAVSMASFGRYADMLGKVFGYSQEDRVLHTASLSFSAAIRQTFGPLCNGAAIVLATEAERRDPGLLFQLMKAQRVTVWDTVPSVWQAATEFLAAVDADERARLLPDCLRSTMLTGEPLKWRTVRMWRAVGGQGKVHNLYSQTETAGTVAAYLLPEDPGPDTEIVPVGQPLGDCEIVLELDEATGEQEICVSSERLASGYLGDAEATIDEFPNRPFHETGFRRTGDTGRMTQDGLLLVTGRLGLVTKIRGQQVSLEAVERVLRAQPDVRDAAAACHDWQNARQLVAYVVGHHDLGAQEDALRRAVLDALGPAAVPAAIIGLDQLPLTKSGKLERSGLPRPGEWSLTDASADGLSASGVLDSIRDVVSEIFCRTLSRNEVRPDRDFFSLGGNSLMATRIVAQIRKAFSIAFPMKSFFDEPTIDGVSKAVEALLLQDLG